MYCERSYNDRLITQGIHDMTLREISDSNILTKTMWSEYCGARYNARGHEIIRQCSMCGAHLVLNDRNFEKFYNGNYRKSCRICIIKRGEDVLTVEGEQ